MHKLSPTQLKDQKVSKSIKRKGTTTTPGPNTQNIITTQADGANSVFAADIDGDGDIDVLSASSNDDKIAWYENTDGKGTFIRTNQNIIDTQLRNPKSVYAVDIDGDGDLDVLCVFSSEHQLR
eukprot:g9781.t1